MRVRRYPHPPLITPLETCTEEGLEFDTSADELEDPHSYLQAKSSVTCKDSEYSGQGDEEKGRGESTEQIKIEMWRMLTEIRRNMATKEDFEPIINNMNEFNSRMEINTTQEDHEDHKDHEDVQPVRAVRVPAHQVSDRKFVKVERKQRKRKNHQTDCKTS